MLVEAYDVVVRGRQSRSGGFLSAGIPVVGAFFPDHGGHVTVILAQCTEPCIRPVSLHWLVNSPSPSPRF